MSSPNYNQRKLPISMLVLHYTGMESGEAARERLFDPAAEVSAHWLVHEDLGAGMVSRISTPPVLVLRSSMAVIMYR